MKGDVAFCHAHWNKLRAEIGGAGLTEFVSPNSAEAARRMKVDAACLHTRDSFDPLVAAHHMIVLKAQEKAGKFYGCPIDFVGESAIKDAVAIVIDHARGLGFIP